MRATLFALYTAALLCITSSLTIADDPPQQSGVLVTAVCGRGCQAPIAPKTVYVLAEQQFQEYQANSKTKIDPNGKTPLRLAVEKPGVYFVGIETAVDTSVVKLKQSGFSPARPAHEDHFADDSPELMTNFVKSSDEPNKQGLFEVNFGLVKWYKVTVRSGEVTPVVALFLEKVSKPASWANYYPKNQAFKLVLPADKQAQFWDFMNDPGSKTPTVSEENRKTLTELLLRGGRVCLPEPERGVVWVDSNGLLHAIRSIPKEKLANPGLDDIWVTIASSPIASFPRTEPKAQTKGGLPPFKARIPAGNNEVRIRNPNGFSVRVGIRLADTGTDFAVGENATESVQVPDGKYEIYFVYSTQPNALYKGDGFTLKSNGVEIQIVKVVNGNYDIRLVK